MKYFEKDLIKEASKIRGRQLRAIRTFLAKNKEWGGHSSRNIEGIIDKEELRSPLRQWISRNPVTKMEGAGVVDTNELKNPIMKALFYPMQTNAFNKKLAK